MGALAWILGIIAALCMVMGIVTALAVIPEFVALDWMFWLVVSAVLFLATIASTLAARGEWPRHHVAPGSRGEAHGHDPDSSGNRGHATGGSGLEQQADR